jgi:hypothetical protein
MTLNWKKVGANSKTAPCVRASHSSVHHNGKIYIFGGQDDDNNKLSDLWEFDLATEQWREIEVAGTVPSARSGHSANIYKGKMYIFGGILELTKELNEMLCYDFASGKFTVMCGEGAGDDNFAFTAGHGGDESPSAIKKLETNASPTKTKKNNFASAAKSPSKTIAARKKAMLGLDKEDAGVKKESGLASPTSISMQNTFIIKNADESFDAYFAQMKKRKFGGNTGLEAGHSATLGGSSPG